MKKLLFLFLVGIWLCSCNGKLDPPPDAPYVEDGDYDLMPDHNGEDYEGVEYGD